MLRPNVNAKMRRPNANAKVLRPNINAKMLRNLNPAKPKLTEDEIKTIEKLPQVLAIQKKKLLIAISKTNSGTGTISQKEEQFVKYVNQSLVKQMNPLGTRLSKQWIDSQANIYVQTILKKNVTFKLHKYLDYAEIMCEIFSRKECPYDRTKSAAMEYLLTHARQFGDHTKTIFQTEVSAADQAIQSNKNSELPLFRSQNTKIERNAKHQIIELREAYDEIKFQALNTQITSFVLLILRRIMKNPNPAYIRSEEYKLSICLVIEAYLKTEDEKTKKNLRETCVKYIEWFDMQLPGLFFKLVDLYGIEADELWDVLTSVKSRKTNKSLIDLADEYYEQYQLAERGVLQGQGFHWFPYCRMFGMDYHRKLSNSANVLICTILSKVIEKKNVLEEPAHRYSCPDNADHVHEWAKPIAEELYAKINK